MKITIFATLMIFWLIFSFYMARWASFRTNVFSPLHRKRIWLRFQTEKSGSVALM